MDVQFKLVLVDTDREPPIPRVSRRDVAEVRLAGITAIDLDALRRILADAGFELV